MPPSHQQYIQWNGERFVKWAAKIGINTKTAVSAILSGYKIEQQGYKACMQKIRRLISELKTAGLFEEEQVGQNMPNLIFLTYIDLSSENPPSAEEDSENNKNSLPQAKHNKARKAFMQADCRKSTVQENTTVICAEISRNSENFKAQEIGLSKINTPDCRKSTPNKTDNNKTDINNQSIIRNNKKYNSVLEETKEQIEYDLLKLDYPSSPSTPNIVDGIAEIITDIRVTDNPYIQVGNNIRATEIFRSKLSELTSLDIADVIERFKNLITPPSNPRAYLTAMLYNAKTDNALLY